MPAGHLNITYQDLQFILDQIKMSEAHAARTVDKRFLGDKSNIPEKQPGSLIYPYDITSNKRCLQEPDIREAATSTYGPTGLSQEYIYSQIDPFGLRQVDGQCNNITGVKSEPVPSGSYGTPSKPSDTAAWGAADQVFPRDTAQTTGPSAPFTLNSAQQAYSNPLDSVRDPQPRRISNLISDQSDRNLAALAAATYSVDTLYPGSSIPKENSVNATTQRVTSVYGIPNVTADYNVSAGYNSWFTLFGQFFDHGLDLIPKGGASVLIPLKADDPLYVPSPGAPNFMVLTRGADSTGNAINSTTPYIDQSQTYGSHPSQNFFLRDYTIASGKPKDTGKLLDSPTGGMPTWKDIKDQARTKLGIDLSDYDVRSIPVIATDQYGNFIPGPTDMPMMLFTNGSQYAWASGSFADPLKTGVTTAGETISGLPGSSWVAVSSGHVFINDTMAGAVPFNSRNQQLTPDSDSIMNSSTTLACGNTPGPCAYYDNESLEAHLVAGDGRINENIGLSSIHLAFHSEHNLLVKDIKDLLANDSRVTQAFKNEWINSNGINGTQRLFLAARFIMEMEYQHMVYDEFIRRIAPGLPLFLLYDPTANAGITQEFASAVYRLGHSMLNETIARSNPGQFYNPNNNQDVSLITAFTNPAQVQLARPVKIASATHSGATLVYTVVADEALPRNGEIVSVKGMVDPLYDVLNGVVSEASGSTFSIASHFAGGDSASAISISPVPTGDSLSKQAPDNSYIAVAAINDPGTNDFLYSPQTAAAIIAQGMSSQRGNEIDEFVTDAVRNNLLGLPLDLASLNITRGRDMGLPTLNQFRRKHFGSLTPYVDWADFISHLRYPESGVNFIAAYGTDASLTVPVTAMTATGATASANTITYTGSSTSDLSVGDVVTISGFGNNFDKANAVIDSIDSGSSFTVSKAWNSAPDSVTVIDQNTQMAPSAFTISGSTAGGATVKRSKNTAELRAAATALLSDNAFMTAPALTSGVDAIDLWIGGLAENPAKQPLTPPMLGPTFQYVFEEQSLRLQDGDRFYYLGRLPGTNMMEEIPAQKFTDIVRRNTPSASSQIARSAATGIIGMANPGFSVSDCAFTKTSGIVPDSVACAANTMSTLANAWTHTGLDNITGFDDPSGTTGVKLSGGAGDDSIQGTAGPDWLSGGLSGGDLIDGYAGNDIIIGGPGEDLLKGGVGNDVINAGESQAGDIADAGPGNDFVHCGNCTGIALSFIGESGNDFIQGGKNADLVLEGGEGNDWVEGLGQADILNGDMGLFLFGNGWSQPDGGNDVLNGGSGQNALSGDGGDDIIEIVDGPEGAEGGEGFDWVTYEYSVRNDNGPNKIGVFSDLGGGQQPPLNLRLPDGIGTVEGLSGTPGNDVLAGTNAADIVVTGVSGSIGQHTLTLTGGFNIPAGQIVRGTGIGAAGISRTSKPSVIYDNGVTQTTIVELTSNNGANISNASISFTSQLLDNPDLITGLRDLVTGTAGWNRFGTTDTWSGGSILLGGDGNDQFTGVGGSNIIHGSAYLHTCIKVAGYEVGADVPCDGGRGYSTMTLLVELMETGAKSPSDLTIVRELLPTSIRISNVAAVASSGLVTYTATNSFEVGDWVTISGLTHSDLNAVHGIVTAANATTFSIVIDGVADIASGTDSGTAVMTDTITLTGTPARYTISAFTGTLPLGATSGFTIVGPVAAGGAAGNSVTETLFDVQMVKFGVNGVAAPIVVSESALASVGITTDVVAGVVTINPAFAPGTRSYAVSIPNSANTITFRPVAVTAGSKVEYRVGAATVALTTVTGNPLSFTINGLNTLMRQNANTNPNVLRTINVSIVVTAASQAAVTYNFVISREKLEPHLIVANTTPSGFTVQTDNYDSYYTYTVTTSAGTVSPASILLSATASHRTGSQDFVVTGLTPSAPAVVTIVITRPGFATSTTTINNDGTIGSAEVPTFDTPVGSPTGTPTGFTVHVKNYKPAFTYEVIASIGNVSVSGADITVTNVPNGTSSEVTVNTRRAGYTSGTAKVTGWALDRQPGFLPAHTPTFGTITSTSTGFTAVITNWDPSFTWATVGSNNNVTITGPNVAGQGLVTVTGLTPNTTISVTITAKKTDYIDGSAVLTGTAQDATALPTFDNPVGYPSGAPTGFKVNITNYNKAFTYAISTSAGTVTPTASTAGSPSSTSGTTQLLTVTGLRLGDPATVTVTATNPGKASSTAYITGYALDSQPTGNAALYPQFGSVTRTADGFTVPISNYDPSYQWTTSPTSGISVTGTLNSGLLTVTGLAPGASLSVTVITTRNSYLSGFATITGTALAGTPSAGDLHFTVPEPHSYPAGTSVPMTAAGGVGTGRISFTTVTSGCRIRNNVLTVSSAPVDCAVTATKAASIGFPSSTITDSFHFDKVAQAALVVSGSSPTAAAGSTITLRASGGSGSGAVTFNVSGVSGSCSITYAQGVSGTQNGNNSRNRATLRCTGKGIATVYATKAASTIYLVQQSPEVTFTFN